MKKLTMVLAGLGLLIGMATSATAFQGGGPDETRMQQGMDRMADRLELTDQQRTRMKQIHDEARPGFEDIGKRMQANRQAMRQLDPAAASYDGEVARLAHEKGQLVEQMAILRSHVRAQTHAILTPAQQAKAKTMWQERRDRKGKGNRGNCPRNGSGPGMGPGPGAGV